MQQRNKGEEMRKSLKRTFEALTAVDKVAADGSISTDELKRQFETSLQLLKTAVDGFCEAEDASVAMWFRRNDNYAGGFDLDKRFSLMRGKQVAEDANASQVAMPDSLTFERIAACESVFTDAELDVLKAQLNECAKKARDTRSAATRGQGDDATCFELPTIDWNAFEFHRPSPGELHVRWLVSAFS